MHQGATDHFPKSVGERKHVLARTLTCSSATRPHRLHHHLRTELPSFRTGTPTKHS
jgi:hypothetical protein